MLFMMSAPSRQQRPPSAVSEQTYAGSPTHDWRYRRTAHGVARRSSRRPPEHAGQQEKGHLSRTRGPFDPASSWPAVSGWTNPCRSIVVAEQTSASPGSGSIVFVDGCFWHRCPEHFVTPKTRTEFWMTKIARNVERDAETDAALSSSGRTGLRLWEHQEPAACADQIEAMIDYLMNLKGFDRS